LHKEIKDKKNNHEGITQKYTKLKAQDEGIARTQCSKLQKMKLTLEKTI